MYCIYTVHILYIYCICDLVVSVDVIPRSATGWRPFPRKRASNIAGPLLTNTGGSNTCNAAFYVCFPAV